MIQFDLTSTNKPSVADRLRADIKLHDRSIELAFINRRYSIHKSDADFQLSLNLTRDRLALKRKQLADLVDL